MPPKKKLPTLPAQPGDSMSIHGIRTHNLKDIDITLPKNKIITITWVSGSGKSSLAFDTIYKEGQFRYIESLSSYLRQFFNLGTRPEIDYSVWLSPAIAIEQNKRVGNARSTVGTLTEIDDYLRLLLAKLGEVYCYVCGAPLKPKTTEHIVADLQNRYADQKVYLVQDLGICPDNDHLQQFVKKNRKMADQWGGTTRYLVALDYKQTDETHDDLIEYFYLEEPRVPASLFPVKIYGIFDRVTINQSTRTRLKDDIIKMLGRTEKFGVFVQDAVQKKESANEAYHVVLLHGYQWRPENNWFPWLAETLKQRGCRVDIPELPSPDRPDIDQQVEAVHKQIKLTERTIILGHSLGGVIAQKIVEQSKTPIAGMILVSSYCQPKLKSGRRAYMMTSDRLFDAEKIKRNAPLRMVLHDDNDTEVPKAQAKQMQEMYDAHLITTTAREEHFCAVEEPEILDIFEQYFGVTNSTVQMVASKTPERLTWYTDKYYCPKDNIAYPEFTPQHFSANRQDGACTKCHGLGEVLQVDFQKVLDHFSPYKQAILPRRESQLGQAILQKLAQKYDVNDSLVWKDLPDRFREVVLQGDNELIKLSLWGGKFTSMYYRGVEDVLTGQYQKGILTVDFQAMLDIRPCPTCGWAKIRQESLHVFLVPRTKKQLDQLLHKDELPEKYSLFDLQKLPIQQLVSVMDRFQADHPQQTLAQKIVRPLLNRAETIATLGLGYLQTMRQIDSLSGGEIQRLRLAKQLGNKLTGIIYVLDEPTIGLDDGEIVQVIDAIKQLKMLGNSIIVVEHNDTFIKASEWIVEVGPGAGDFWGKILFNGPMEEFLKADTLTAQYITGKKKVQAEFDHTPSRYEVNIKKATKHNLKWIDVSLKLGSFTAITWASGAGKTTLLYHTLYKFLNDKQQFIQGYIRLQLLKEWLNRQEILQASIVKREKYEHLEQLALQEFYKHLWVETITWYEEIDNVVYVDQTSIGKTPRSCPATFIGVFDDIRKMYANVPEAKMLAFNAGYFSFNSSKGACPECQGYGYKKVELQFLPDTYVPCVLCKGNRYKPEILDIKWHGKSIAEILEMYVMDAYELFGNIWFIAEKLHFLCEIGLGYLRMGQPAHTLSGGESQRIKLVKHLLKQYRGHTVYFLDEPTVGLHPSDIEKLLKVLKQFLDKGDTILMIEHERNLLRFADHVIHLDNGGIRKVRGNK